MNEIAQGVASLRSQREAAALSNAVALGDIRTEIQSFCERLEQLGAANRDQVVADRAAMAALLHELGATVREQVGALLGRVTTLETALGGEVVALGAPLASLREQITQAYGAQISSHDLLALVSRLDQQSVRLDHLGALLAELGRIYPSWEWTAEAGDAVRTVMSMLRPMDTLDRNKLRVGRDFDGGYVMLDDFQGIAAALSLGIADDVSWDLCVAARGIPVLQFDPSVTGSPVPHELFCFEQLRVAPQDGEGSICLDTIVSTRVERSDRPLLLKIDIEGDEWGVFQAASAATLGRFRQIVCEFHNLERLYQADFIKQASTVFEKLARTHFVYHVHGNNCGNFANVGNVIVPQSLEVSFARRGTFEAVEGRTVFPTPLDRPNQPGRADLFLGHFQFGADAPNQSATSENASAHLEHRLETAPAI
jgi:hypothetical protein